MKLYKQSRSLCITSIIVTVVGVKRYWQLESSRPCLKRDRQLGNRENGCHIHPQTGLDSNRHHQIHVCCILHVVYCILYILYCIFYILYCNLESSMRLCILWECCCFSPLSSQTRSIFNKIPYRVSSNLGSRIFKM